MKEWNLYFDGLTVEAQIAMMEFDGENIPAAILDSTEPIFTARITEKRKDPLRGIIKEILDSMVDPEKCAECDDDTCVKHPDYKGEGGPDLGKKEC